MITYKIDGNPIEITDRAKDLTKGCMIEERFSISLSGCPIEIFAYKLTPSGNGEEAFTISFIGQISGEKSLLTFMNVPGDYILNIIDEDFGGVTVVISYIPESFVNIFKKTIII